MIVIDLIQPRGYLEQIDYVAETGQLAVSGWMLCFEGEIERFDLWFNGRLLGPLERVDRPNVAGFLPTIPHAGRSGFRFFRDHPPGDLDGMTHLAVTGTLLDGRQCRLETWFDFEAKNRLPVAPPELMQRTVHNVNPRYNLCLAMQSYRDFWSRVTQHHSSPDLIRRVLDWGCGCGRLTAPLLEYSGVAELHGCDIDPESISWCQSNLEKGRFRTVDPYPPTEYPSDWFDVIVSNSVLTHLTLEAQELWLIEMRRLLVPGGLLLATVHGDFAARFVRFPESIDQVFQKEGFFDGIQDQTLDGIAPDGYYRSTYQTREHTEQNWAGIFEIVDYAEAGSLNYQDLVVLRKR